MYADPHALLSLADELHARGRSIRRLARDARRDIATVEWHGVSAEAMARLAGLGRERLMDLADQHDRVAELVTAHAHRVADRLGMALDVLHWLESVA